MWPLLSAGKLQGGARRVSLSILYTLVLEKSSYYFSRVLHPVFFMPMFQHKNSDEVEDRAQDHAG